MIDGVTKIKLKLKKNISYFPMLQYFNVCFILLNLFQNANEVSGSLCLETAML